MSTNHIEPNKTFKIEKKRQGVCSRNLPSLFSFFNVLYYIFMFSRHIGKFLEDITCLFKNLLMFHIIVYG